MKVKLTLDKDTCINCGACIPEAYNSVEDKTYIDEDSSGVHVQNVTPKDQGVEEIVLTVNEEQYRNLRNAVEVCPVECIAVEVIEE